MERLTGDDRGSEMTRSAILFAFAGLLSGCAGCDGSPSADGDSDTDSDSDTDTGGG